VQVAGFWIVVAAVVFGAAAGIFAALNGHSASRGVIDEKKLGQAIEQQSNGSLTNVVCPANEKVAAGATFQCTAANNLRVIVTIKDDKGDYEWAPAS
jgi:Domain of unknown function (DUF4333)